ncbi:urease accessory protein UreF [Ahrensia kielensis]|uniref:Urease accessory protein UreF n=2 Tax=Ahrensia kielensis TaxID=76980 RepID=A0ABU9T2I5_9HYPH
MAAQKFRKMNDSASLLKLMSWLSPVFPTGGFSYSSGLETAVQSGLVVDADDLRDWLKAALSNGALHNDAVLFAAALRMSNAPKELTKIAEMALALAGSAERYLEMTAQGDAFIKAVINWPDADDVRFPSPCPLCVAAGAAGGASKIDLTIALSAYLHSAITNQAQAAIRLSVTGQNGASNIMAALEPDIIALAEFAAQSDMDDVGSAAMNAEIMSMRHEHLNGRMFRS